MGKSYRPERLGEEIRRLISELILRELNDPRLSGIVSISNVDVTGDYSFATVYISLLGASTSEEADEENKKDVLAAFQSAKGYIKKEIGRKIKLHHVPELLFRIDTSMEYGRHISHVIAELGITHSDETEEAEHDEETKE
ncbi:MAG: 30S ribosome-binding factor RbfA [Eubacteriales bacterium]|nr:30S ribosome-binding factor RbfA [Eubacteriales bacterium]MDD3349567.1 30S ribosome-binding factor RbfA [Eubacteriales bacterium]